MNTRLLLATTTVLLAAVGCRDDAQAPSEPAPTRAQPAAAAATGLGNMISLGPPTLIAYGINSTGQIVGASRGSSGADQAFFWQAGSVAELQTLGGGSAVASDINDAGVVVGESALVSGQGGHAALWRNGTITDLGTLPNACFSFAYAINSVGTVVGMSPQSCGGIDYHAMLWENGRLRDLGPGEARDINDDGQVVGISRSHAFLWDNGVMQDLGTLGQDYSIAEGISSSGQVVGRSRNSAGQEHAFLWSNGAMRDLGTLGGGASSGAHAINDNGQVVGYSETLTSTLELPYRAFIWQNGIMTDLGTLPANYTDAMAINNSGLVVGTTGTSAVFGGSVALRWTIPTTNFWSELRALPSSRRAHAVGAAGGLIYVIGGRNSAGTVLSSVQAYNPSTNSWSTKASLPAPRHSGDGAATLSGTIYVAGGRTGAGSLSRTLYAYQTSSNTWSTRASMPVASGCGGSAAINGKLYVFSGCTLSSTGTQIPAGLLHRYNPGTNSWTTLHTAPAAHLGPAVGATGGKLYVVGGTNSANYDTRRVDVYDPATNTWSTKAPMPTARVNMAGAVIAGKFYVFGGENSAGTAFRSVVEVYDPLINSWSTKAGMLVPRSGLAAGVVNNLVYTIGGRYKTKVLALNERYTP